MILFAMTGFGNNPLKVLKELPFVELISLFTVKRPKKPFPYYPCEKIHDLANKYRIPVYEGLSLKEKSCQQLIRKLYPDLIVVSSFNQIIPKSIISLPKFGVINIHPSLLPRYRGPTPTVWTLMNGETETGVTAHFIENDKIDSGRIIVQRRIRINASDNDGILRHKLARLSEKVLMEALRTILIKEKKAFAVQDEDKATFYPKYKLSDSELDINKPLKAIVNKIKAMTPYPGARLKYCNNEYIVDKVTLLRRKIIPRNDKETGRNIIVRTHKRILKFHITKGNELKNNVIRHTQSTYGIRPEAQDFPMMCVLSFVYVCNSLCPNCPYTNSKIREDYKNRPFMPEDTFKIIADQCGRYNAWIRLSGGGEPMLHPKAVELIEYAKRVGAKVGLITNGSKFNEENSKRILEAQIDMTEFSVDAADPYTYAKVRKGLDWDTLVRNVKRMVQIRNRLKSSTRIIASVVNQIGVDINKVEKFWEGIVDKVQKRKYLTWGINDSSKAADPAPYLPPEELIPCPFIFERLNIDSRGRVMVCGFDIAAKTNMGNVHETSIKEIWHGNGFEYYRKMHLAKKGNKIALCKDCPDWKYRSWRYNYWKIIEDAEIKRTKRINSLNTQHPEDFIASFFSNEDLL